MPPKLSKEERKKRERKKREGKSRDKFKIKTRAKSRRKSCKNS